MKNTVFMSKYVIKFDFKAQNVASQGAIYLVDSNMGGSSEPAEFELLGLFEGAFCAGVYNFGSDWSRPYSSDSCG